MVESFSLTRLTRGRVSIQDGSVRVNDMVRRHRQLLGSFGLWGLLASGLVACSATQGSVRCDPSVDMCDTTDTTSSTSTATGSGGMGGASSTMSTTTSGSGGSTTGGAGKAGSGGSGGSGGVDAGRTITKKIVA